MTGLVIVVVLLAGFVGFLLGARERRSREVETKPGPAATPVPPPIPPVAEPTPVVVAPPAGDLEARLIPLRQAIEAASEDASHPRELVDHEQFKQAVALLVDPSVARDVVVDFALAHNWAMSAAAFAALTQRGDQEAVLGHVMQRFELVSPWPLYFALEFIERAPNRPPLGEPLLRAHPQSANHGLVPAMFTAHFRRREALGDAPTFGATLGADVPVRPVTEAVLNKIDHPFAKALLAEIAAWNARRVDKQFLQGIGRVWSGEPDPLLIEYPAIAEPLDTMITALTHTPPRSVVLVGEARVGKTALAKLAGEKLIARGYTIFEASGPELQAGQKYIGELEARLRRLVAELAAEKRVVWYVPDLLQILLSGTHQGQAAGILEQLLPDLASGRLVMLSECTPGGLTRALQYRPALRNVFDVVRLRTLAPADVAGLIDEFLARVARVLGIGIEPGLAGHVAQLARHYLSGMQLPGAELDLIKLAGNRAVAGNEAVIGREALLATLAQLTGLPRAVLDDSEKMELASVHEFFGARVIGQDEAVTAVVERIAMFKAGLTDPGRPIGVFLFAGPTGTGKTELAKTLSEYLFGAADRLLRLDMSEYQMASSTEKIFGAGLDEAEGQSLIQRVRKQPFAVILLDEFEKAHQNVWDLFLQVFDDGRLTDSAGKTADFRHTLIILTSNLGATSHQSAGVGFQPRADAFSQDQVRRAVAQSFRPEFVNRLDKVIVFRPLTRDRMRSILRKELARVLERRGLANREWAVEWESSALEFLLEKGFTADMGARPLKRAIDQHLLAPLAATMVERRFPVGDQFLFVRSDGEALQVEFVDPNAELPLPGAPAPVAAGAAAEGPASEVATSVLQPTGTRAERDQLMSQLTRLERDVAGAEWEALREGLVAQMSDPGFWDRVDRARVLARYALMDRLKAALTTARSLAERHGRGLSGKSGQYSRELAARFALQLLLVERGLRDALEDAPIEVILRIEPAMETGGDPAESRRWCTRIAAMYSQWAGLRRMPIVPRELPGGPTLLISGFGAHRVLLREAGLHVLETEGARSVVRVRVAPSWSAEDAAQVPATTIEEALAAQPPAAAIVRRYRFEPSPLVRDAERGWRTGRLEDVLGGNFDLF